MIKNELYGCNSSNENRNKNGNRKRLIITLLLLTACLSSGLYCGAVSSKKKENNEYPSVPERYYDFDEYLSYKIVDGEKGECYSAENIGLLIDKVTNDVEWYLYKNGLISESYELESGRQIAYVGVESYGVDYWNSLINDSYTFEMLDINNYLENVVLKKYYTLGELKSLEPELRDALLIMNNVNRDVTSEKVLSKVK